MREEEKKRSSQSSKWKGLTKKRWFLPALYISSVAVLLTGILLYQASNSEFTKDPSEQKRNNATSQKKEPSIEVNHSLETFKVPVADADSVVIKKEFYNVDGDEKQREASLVFYNNTYQPNTGIDYAMKDGKEFDVTASLSGKVVSVEEDTLLGNLIVIEHDKGVETHYSSVDNIKVKAGDTVKQGDTLATASKSVINEEAGTHVHFEIRKDRTAVNPLEYFQKPLSALKAEKPMDNTESKTEKTEAKKKQAE